MTKSNRQTRRAQVATALVEEISAGVFPVGTDLPSEADLCAEFGVSRYTVREALRHLSDFGLIVRRQGSGSKVVATSPKRGYVLTVDTEADVLRYASETSLRIIPGQHTVPETVLSEFNLDEADAWVALQGVRTVGSAGAIGLITVYLRQVHAEFALSLTQPVRTAIYSSLLEHLGATLSNIQQKISATVLTDDQARQLGAVQEEPALRIVRRYDSDFFEPLEISVQVHPSSRFEYTLDIKPMPGSDGSLRHL